MSTRMSAPTRQAPLYTHDGGPEDGCRYLGSMTPPAQYAPAGVEVVDLWVHTYEDGACVPSGRVSVIYRYADDGPEYESTPYRPGVEESESYVRRHPVFAEVLRRMEAG